MMIAPHATIDSGTIEYVHWGRLDASALYATCRNVRRFAHKTYDASRRTATRIEFELNKPLTSCGCEVLTLEVESLEVLPGPGRDV